MGHKWKATGVELVHAADGLHLVNATVDPELVDEDDCDTVVLSDRPGVVAVGLPSTSNDGEQRAPLSLVPQLTFSNSSLIHSQKCS